MEHLDPKRLEALLADPKAHRPLVDHLARGCDECEAFLERHAPDALEGEADALLLRLRGERPAQLDEVGWRRLRRGLGRPTPLWRGAVALAAGLALAAGVGLVVRSSLPPDGLKGEGPRIQLELSAAVVLANGDTERVDTGARVKPSGVLVLRYHATEPGFAALWIQRGDAAPERLGDAELESGTHDLSRGDELLGLSLDGERGKVTMWVVAGKAPTSLPPAQAEQGVHSGALKDVAVGRISVLVEP